MKLYIPYEDHDGRHVLTVNPRDVHYFRSLSGRVTVSSDILGMTDAIVVTRGIYLSEEDARRAW